MTIAVILIAGTNDFHEQNFGKVPRAIIDLGRGETILERQIRLLNQKGITDIIVVIGFEKEQIMRKYPNLNYVISDPPYTFPPHHQMHSLMQSKYLWKEDEELLVISGDVVFDEQALTEILETPLHFSGFSFFGQTHSDEIYMMRVNKTGMDYLKLLEEKPFVVPYHQILLELKGCHMNEIRNHLWTIHGQDQIGTKVNVSGFMLDIDGVSSLNCWKSHDDLIKVGYAFVVGDLLHYGHINFFRQCKKYCDFLIVGVYTDELTMTYKRKPIIPFEQRIELIRELKTVDMVATVKDKDCTPMLEYLTNNHWKIRYLFHGDDWKDVEGRDYIESIGGKLILIPYTEGINTTMIIDKIRRQYCGKGLS